MNVLKKLFQKQYCENCKYKNAYYENEIYIADQRNREKQKAKTEKMQNHFLKNVKSILPKDETILFISVDTSSPLVLITLKTTYDIHGKIENLTFQGYTHDYLKKPTGNFIKQEMYVSAKYEKVNENASDEYLHHFFIFGFPCTPNMGYGSMIMDTVLDYLKQFKSNNNRIYIRGWLSPVDKRTHNERLHHFYKKFGFNFTFDEGEEYVIKYL